MPDKPPASPAQLFYSYSHKDVKLRDQLETHLSTLKREKLIAAWHDRRITAGTEWKGAIDDNLKNAHIILLLVTANFLASDYCNDVELQYAMERHEEGAARVIPIILRPCDWHTAVFAKLQALPIDGKPVTDWKSRDNAFLNVVEGIRKVLKEISSGPLQPIGISIAKLPAPSISTPAQQQIASTTPALNALHQLPTPPADFIGRQAELNELLEAVKTAGVTISGLQGQGGIGKTALALKLAAELKPDYPDAQFYLDLKGVSPQPLTPRDAMAYIVRAYHPTAQLPEKEEELAALYRSVLDGKRVLLLMDNARDAQQVSPLIPPSSCLLLVTSRRHFILPGQMEKNLDKLSPSDARDLLLRLVPRLKKEKPAQVDDLAHLCGYLPMALRAVGSALAIKRNINTDDYISRLQQTGKDLVLKEVDPLLQTTVGAALQSSYEFLSAELQKKFRFLSVFPDTFDLAAAAAIWEIVPEDAEAALSNLIAYSLVEFNEVSQRYEYHDLTRLFAHQLLTPEELYITQQRHAGHYLAVLWNSNTLYRKGSDFVQKAIALFDVERTNVETGHGWTVAHQGDSDLTAEWCWQYPRAGFYCLILRQPPRESIKWLEPALKATKRLKKSQLEGAVLGHLGIAYYNLGEYRRAIGYYEQHIKIARETGDRQGEASTLGNLGNAYRRLGDNKLALKYSEQSFKVTREIGDRRGEANALGSMGNAYSRLQDRKRALKYYKQQLQIVREIGDRLGEAVALFNSALALDELEQRNQAISCAATALKIFEVLDVPNALETRALLDKWRAEHNLSGKNNSE